MASLTKRQKQILDYISKYISEKGYSPTFEEICRHFKLSALSTVHQHIEALASKGYLSKNEHSARGIELNKNDSNFIEIPIKGTIAAGEPIEAIEMPDVNVSIPKQEINLTRNHHALRVKGDSMINEGIFDGDIVIIRQQNTADNGQTVVAIIDDNEATLKKLYREKNQFRLQPANPSLLPFYRKEVEIRGLVVKIIRNFENKKSNYKESTSNDKYSRRIDYTWDFKGEKVKSYTHGLHTYPAMFIPQVARRLLQTYSKKNDTICDIFCGSGTTLVESRLLGRNSYGIDLNPLAIFLARVKTIEINPSILTKEYFSLISRIENYKGKKANIPNFKNIDFWFKEKVIIQLARIKDSILQIQNKKIKEFFLVAFSETVRLSSNSKNGEFKLVRIKGDKLKDFNPAILSIFRKKAEQNIKGMNNFYNDVNKKTWVKIIQNDSSKDNKIKPDSIDCIVTSPPYGDSHTTVAYGQFSRLSAQWIDLFQNADNASKVDNELLGGRIIKNLSNNLKSKYLQQVIKKISKQDEKRACEVLYFNIGLNECLKRAYTIMKKNKYMCIVIGNRLVKQVRIPTDYIIAELCEQIGFSCEDIFIRNIPGKRMPKKTSPTNIAGALEETMNKESIVILKKL
ncbi:transcriptional repressor LexA [Patescibacteria group bacterium]|nr:transcriptional repressor LexA [Patescibacteria group bacterium]